MKVYSWKTLLAAILIGGGALIHFSVRLSKGDLLGIPWLIIFGVLTVKGLWTALTEKGYKKDIENAERGKRIYQARFGRLAPIASNGLLIFVAVALVFAWLFPWHPEICACTLIAGGFYQAWLIGIIREAITKEQECEEKYQEG